MLDTVRAYGLERLAEAGEDTAGQGRRRRATTWTWWRPPTRCCAPATQARWFRVLDRRAGQRERRDPLGRSPAATRRARCGSSARSATTGCSAGTARPTRCAARSSPWTPPPLTQAARRGTGHLRAARGGLELGHRPDQGAADRGARRPGRVRRRLGDRPSARRDGRAGAAAVRRRHRPAPSSSSSGTSTARDPWLRAIGQVYLSTYAFSLGTLDGAEEHCRAGLAELRALGEQWGVAMALTQLAEFTELRADHAASIAALTEAAAIGRELGVWGDLTYVEARLAVIHARAGDLASGHAPRWPRCERAVAARGGHVGHRPLGRVHARRARLAGGRLRRVRPVLRGGARHDRGPRRRRWWQSLRAQVKARLAMPRCSRRATARRCAALLGEALDAAAAWTEHPALAAVLDACAAHLAHRAADGRPDAEPPPACSARPTRSAARSTSQASDAPQAARDAARAALGPRRTWRRLRRRPRDLGYQQAVALAREALAGALTRSVIDHPERVRLTPPSNARARGRRDGQPRGLPAAPPRRSGAGRRRRRAARTPRRCRAPTAASAPPRWRRGRR